MYQTGKYIKMETRLVIARGAMVKGEMRSATKK
jgi:hypothetical protein